MRADEMNKEELRQKIITNLNTYDECLINIDELIVRIRILAQK